MSQIKNSDGEFYNDRKRGGDQRDAEARNAKKKRVDETENDDDLEDFFDSVDAEDAVSTNAEDNDISKGLEDSEKSNLKDKRVRDSTDDWKQLRNKSNHQHRPVGVDTPESEEKIKSHDSSPERQFDGISQAAYEARLAKLMLMTRRKKNDSTRTSMDTTFDDAVKSIGNELSMDEMNDQEKKKNDSSFSFKDLMKKKTKRKHNSQKHDDNDNDDAYWSNFD